MSDSNGLNDEDLDKLNEAITENAPYISNLLSIVIQFQHGKKSRVPGGLNLDLLL